MSKDSAKGPSRRTFLKTSGLAAVSTVFSEAEQTSKRQSPPVQPHRDPVDWVNILQGTASTQEFSRGNTLPIAALPFGMAHWTLQSHEDTPWMFQPGVRRIQGIRCTHQLSPWLSDYGQAAFLPFRGDIQPQGAERASSYEVEQAHLGPHSLRLFLLRYRAHIELVPTDRTAVLTATFEEDQGGSSQEMIGLLFDIPGHQGTIEPDPATRTIRFTSTANSGGVPDNFATYYLLQLKSPWDSFEVKEAGAHRVGILRFRQGMQIEAHIATSFISFDQAALNLRNEIGQRSVDQLRSSAASIWNDHLNRIEIEGATDDHRRTFYSCLYRTLLFPRTWHEPDADGHPHHFSAFNGKVMPGVMYADHGYWDVYRAWYPLMTILFPERLGEILEAWVNAYKEGGWLPQFPCPGYRACMTGSLIDSVFGDAAAKHITGFDLAGAYEGLKKHATIPGDPAKGYGRVGLEYYLHLQYVPADRVAQSAAETVDAAYGDFCIAQVAKALGRQDDYATFMKRSENWRHVFDPEVKFFRGKNEDGSWLTPFNPFTWGSPYVEGAAWQHRWDAPQNLPGLIESMGGGRSGKGAPGDVIHPAYLSRWRVRDRDSRNVGDGGRPVWPICALQSARTPSPLSFFPCRPSRPGATLDPQSHAGSLYA
jgi:predicted alpha-1,2-mannosidase